MKKRIHILHILLIITLSISMTSTTWAGSELCYMCDGSGDCDICMGSGNEDCSSCIGSGACFYCDGMGGELTYVSLGENEWRDCSYCNGSGDCNRCNGSGVENCFVCYGSGDCDVCNGSGYAQTSSGAVTEEPKEIPANNSSDISAENEVSTEKYTSSKLSFIFAVDSNDDVASAEPAVVVHAPDGLVYAWTSSDVIIDDAAGYYVSTDLDDTSVLYEAEIYNPNHTSGLVIFRLDVEPEDVKNQSKLFELHKVYPDEMAECYLFDEDYVEHKLTLQINGADEINGLYFANYIVPKDEINKISSFNGPGVLFNMDGQCVGILCEESTEDHDVLLFGEPMER